MSKTDAKVEVLEVETFDEEITEFIELLESFGLNGAVINAFLGKFKAFPH